MGLRGFTNLTFRGIIKSVIFRMVEIGSAGKELKKQRKKFSLIKERRD